jgi:hypothetical protein
VQARSLRWKQQLLFFLRKLVVGTQIVAPEALQKPGLLCQTDATWLSVCLLAAMVPVAALHMAVCACGRAAAGCRKRRPPAWSTGMLATARPEEAVCFVALPGALPMWLLAVTSSMTVWCLSLHKALTRHEGWDIQVRIVLMFAEVLQNIKLRGSSCIGKRPKNS